MVSQIFQYSLQKKIFFDFLEKYCNANTKQFIFTKESYKRAQIDNAIKPFCENLKKYYFPSKYKYLTRDQKYKTFITIIRQICKYHHIPFTSKINYSKSQYEIKYFIYRKDIFP